MMRKILLLLFLWVVLLLVGFSLLVSTQQGLTATIYLARHLIPGQLIIKNAQGKLFGKLEITDLNYTHQNTQLKLHKLELDWHPSDLLKNQLNIEQLNIKKLQLHLTSSDQPITFDWIGIHLPIDIILNHLTVTNLAILQTDHAPFIIDNLSCQGKVVRNIVYLTELNAETKHYKLITKGYTGLSFPFKHHITGSFIANNQQNFLTLNYFVKGDIKHSFASIQSLAPFSGYINIASQDLPNAGPVHVIGNWKNITLPMDKNNHISSTEGQLALTGALKDFKLVLNTDISGTLIPDTKIKLLAIGNIMQNIASQFNIQTLSGQIKGQAHANWQPHFSWDFNLNANHLNPALKWNSWAGQINFAANGHSIQQGESTDAYFALTNLTGILNNIALNGKAIVQHENTGWIINNAYFTSGNNLVQINGRIDKVSALQWNIRLLDLKELTKAISGNIITQGSFTGTRKDPRINSHILINNFQYKNSLISNLKANINFNLTGYSLIQLLGQNIQINTQKINQININAQGTLAAHNIAATIQNQQQNLTIRAFGNYLTKQNQWHINGQQFTLNSTLFGNWHLNNPINLTIGKNIRLSNFCWQSAQSAICAQGGFQQKDNWNIYLTLKHINTGMLKAFLPDTINTSSDINGLININRQHNAIAKGVFDLEFTQAMLSYQSEQKKEELQFENSYIKGSIDKTGLSSQIYIKDKQHQLPISGKINLPGFNGTELPNQNTKLSGKLTALWPSLKFLNALIPNVSNINGQINANVNLAGTIGNPKLNGLISLSRGTFDIDKLKLNIHNIIINILFDNSDKVNITGRANSGNSVLFLNGYTNLSSHFSPIVVKFTGNRVIAYNTEEYKVFINPNITLTYEAPKLSLSGDILIPEAHVTPKDFTTTVELPDNVVLLGKNEQSTPFPLYYNFKINLGNDVDFKYAGLTTQLIGSVTLNKEPEQIITAIGSLQAVKGYYSAYGQNLKIATGNLLFTGGSVTNPNLNILATKTINSNQANESINNINDKMTVGIRVTGAMNNPKISFYSAPKMPSANVLSYLLFGQDSNSLSDAKFQLLSQAASSMGSSGLGMIDTIKGQLKLSQLSVESAQVYNPQKQQVEQNTSFVLGKQLSKRLSINYSIGILVPINILRVKYILSKHFFLQSDASAYGSGADVIYSLQTN